MNGNGMNGLLGMPPPGLGPEAFQQYLQQMESRQAEVRQAAHRHQQELQHIYQHQDQAYEDLIKAFKQLTDQFTRKCEDFENEVESRRMWHRQALESKRQLEQLELAADASPFAAVILDGDGALFRDDLLARGHEGGVEAAHMLLNNVKTQLKAIYPKSNIDDWNIVLQLAVSLPGLGKKLVEVGIIGSQWQLHDFVHGFNFSQPLFSIVDVGKGNQRADGKCREMARLMMGNKQCKHIFFGPCHDTGYIQSLQALRDPFAASQRVTLVETIPALPGFRELKLPFTKFSVFRSEHLPPSGLGHGHPNRMAVAFAPPPQQQQQQRHASVPDAANIEGGALLAPPPAAAAARPPAAAAAVARPPATASSSNNPSSTSWATVGKSGAGVPPSGKINIAPAKKPAGKKFYLINKDSERVDEDLPRANADAEKKYQARRAEHGSHCNEHYLRGTCDPKYCSHYHGAALPKAELLVLRHKARSGVCNYGSECDDPECFYGHHCRYGRHCTTGSDCRFNHLHHVDVTPAYRVYEDGSRESLG